MQFDDDTSQLSVSIGASGSAAQFFGPLIPDSY